MSRRLRRGAVAAAAAIAVGSVAAGAAAYYALTSTQASATFAVPALSPPTSPAASAGGPTTVALSWTAPATQLPGARYSVTNTTDGHAVCTVSGTTCTDTAALPGTVNAYAIAATLPGTSWTTAAAAFQTSTATPDALALTTTSGGALGPVTAGTAFGLRVTARRWNGSALVTDTAYAGPKTIAWSGLAAAPNGAIPVYPATSVAFTSGASTTALNATAFAAGAATLTATEGARTGSASFAVNAAGGVLRFTSAAPSCAAGSIAISAAGGTFTAKVSRDTDAYGNAVTVSGTPTVSLSAAPASKGTFSTATLTYAAGAGETAVSFTWTASSANPSVVITAATPGLGSATCSVKQS
jgi:hypothetical protein